MLAESLGKNHKLNWCISAVVEEMGAEATQYNYLPIKYNNYYYIIIMTLITIHCQDLVPTIIIGNIH